jgi:hypothetical protein
MERNVENTLSYDAFAQTEMWRPTFFFGVIRASGFVLNQRL